MIQQTFQEMLFTFTTWDKFIHFPFLTFFFYVGVIYPTESLPYNLSMDLKLQFEKYYFRAYTVHYVSALTRALN